MKETMYDLLHRAEKKAHDVLHSTTLHGLAHDAAGIIVKDIADQHPAAKPVITYLGHLLAMPPDVRKDYLKVREHVLKRRLAEAFVKIIEEEITHVDLTKEAGE